MSGGASAHLQSSEFATATALAVEEVELTSDPGKLLGQIVSAMENGGHKMLAHMLESGSAVLRGDELCITVAQPPAMIDLIMANEPRRLATAAASTATGRPVKVFIVSGAAPAESVAPTRPQGNGNGASARTRAADDPVVQRMREKFGAEIRTVIDHRNKS